MLRYVQLHVSMSSSSCIVLTIAKAPCLAKTVPDAGHAYATLQIQDTPALFCINLGSHLRREMFLMATFSSCTSHLPACVLVTCFHR